MSSGAPNMPCIIAKKRDGQELTTDEIRMFVDHVVRGEVPREQIGALLMAIYLRDMSLRETVDFTHALQFSGDVLKWPQFAGQVVDKHSTGGVGDKISLPLAPALAAVGLKVPMISGRGLGHTGGTLDKLESIPGFGVNVDAGRMAEILESVGCCIVSQTKTLVPGDRVLYALRDITSTVGSIPLITASIVSKKLAEGLTSLLLDIKVGRAAFMRTLDEAVALGSRMVGVGNDAGVRTVGLVTRMDHPIGFMVGNAMEVAESVECLQGRGPRALEDLVVAEGGYLLALNGTAPSPRAGMDMIRRVLHDGSALEKFRAMLVAQGCQEDTAAKLCVEPWAVLGAAPFRTPLATSARGFVADINALLLAEVVCGLGAGRLTTDDAIDHAVGLELAVVVGDAVEAEHVWLVVHHRTPTLDPHRAALLQSALVLAAEPVVQPSWCVGVIEQSGTAGVSFREFEW
eukprot:gnl/Spiro4/645_TR366_c0_g1_i1.p1 gnl/Spiro4/645_TR366_c0_g1~~gnl/Spiro4/645_TR366_c0_g1_i1.p1  ORF type:complete len:459 (+),score=127.58 gnl/Spiro4/645_TR366_c0_g1_i1:80-1456(+)